MTHQLVTCLVRERFEGHRGERLNQVKVTLDWSSHFGDGVLGTAVAESVKFPIAKGFKCEASIDSDFWRHDPRTWESIIPIVTNGIRRMTRGKP